MFWYFTVDGEKDDAKTGQQMTQSLLVVGCVQIEKKKDQINCSGHLWEKLLPGLFEAH